VKVEPSRAIFWKLKRRRWWELNVAMQAAEAAQKQLRAHKVLSAQQLRA
jgi:hypothetical protein